MFGGGGFHCGLISHWRQRNRVLREQNYSRVHFMLKARVCKSLSQDVSNKLERRCIILV